MKDDDGAKYPMVAVDDALAIVLEHTALCRRNRSRCWSKWDGAGAAALPRRTNRGGRAISTIPRGDQRRLLLRGQWSRADAARRRGQAARRHARDTIIIPEARAATSRRARPYQRAPTPSRSRSTAPGMVLKYHCRGRRAPTSDLLGSDWALGDEPLQADAFDAGRRRHPRGGGTRRSRG